MDDVLREEAGGPQAVGLEVETKVPVPDGGAEAPVISQERWEQIQRRRGAGESVSAIAREEGLDRKTVRRALRQAAWRPYRREAVGATILAPHAAWLAQRAAEVHYSARILYQELRATRGYTGGYDTVKLAVRPLRAEATVAALTQTRFETAPGQQAQADWGQARVAFSTGPAKVHFFVLTLGYSRRAWAEAYPHERLGALLSAHEHAFAHFGGCPAEILYDRMRTVVAGTAESRPQWNATFAAFAQYWGFEARLCRPYRAQTKGKVESGVKYVKRNFLPGRFFRDLEDFNEQLRAWQAEVADVRVHGTTHERPLDRFAGEAGLLARRAEQPSFLAALRRERVVADDWLVAIDTNRYSVPWQLIGKTVEVVRVGATWQITHQGKVVAEPTVLAGRYQVSIDPAHGPGATARNPRRRFGAAPPPASHTDRPATPSVEIRDLSVYETILEVA